LRPPAIAVDLALAKPRAGIDAVIAARGALRVI
jgi:hypothetical protein